MKKILFAAFAATLLAAGCQKTEVIGTTDHGPAMTFSTEMKKITKAGEGTDETPYTGELPDGNTNLQTNGFNIWAYADYDLAVNSNNVDSETKIYDGMNGTQVTYDPATQTWNPGQEYYWPAENRYLMFFALSAKNGTIPANTEPTHAISNPYGDNNFEGAYLDINGFVVDNLAPNNDLMVANFRKQNSSQDDKAVNLYFRHALTKVQFVFKTSSNPLDENNAPINGVPLIFVQKVEVQGLKNKGNLKVTAEQNTGVQETTDDAIVASVDLNWGEEQSKTADPADAVFAATWPKSQNHFPDQFARENTTTESTSGADDKKSLLLNQTEQTFATWFMLPQSLSGKMVKITYVINKRQFSAMFPLEGSTGNSISEWGVNQYVKYNISLTPDMILFDAEVNDWTPQDGDRESLQD